MVIQFTAPVAPIAKARPRVTMVGGKARAYTPKKTAQYEAVIASYCSGNKLGGPVRVELGFYLPIPKSWSKKAKADALSGVLRPTSRPDIDNYEKAVYDALDGLAFEDDSQIVENSTALFYDENPRVTVLIYSLD